MFHLISNFLACATCMPNSDSRIAMAGNSAILFMLCMLVVVLGSIFGFIIYLMRRAQLVADSGIEGHSAESTFPPNSQ